MDSGSNVNIKAFLASDKSMIVAPAGHGKTHTIVDCLEYYEFSGKKILILTHTNAGIASIKEKIADRNITSKYDVQTICGFALDLANNYISPSVMPDDSDISEKYRVAQTMSINLLKAKPIRRVIRAKYEHVIVDEYQDCDTLQHLLIEQLSKSIPVHILGDHMQAIFDFNGDPIDLNSVTFDDYRKNCQKLTTPWRWIKSGNIELGKDLMTIRGLLDAGEDIDITKYKSIEYIRVEKGDLYRQDRTSIQTVLANLLRKSYKSDVLVIHPQSFKKESRIKVLKHVYNLGMVESIDDRDYYETIVGFESKYGNDLIAAIAAFVKTTCVASFLKDWIRDNGGLVDKKNPSETEVGIMHRLKKAATIVKESSSAQNILDFILYLQKEFTIRVVRTDVYYTIIQVLRDAISRKISLSESLKINRDKTRKLGHHLKGKYIGTTLLTKGLECDTVLILDADKFDSPKHLYVALSRACSRLIVASSKTVLSPYKKSKSTQKKSSPSVPSLFADEDFI